LIKEFGKQAIGISLTVVEFNWTRPVVTPNKLREAVINGNRTSEGDKTKVGPSMIFPPGAIAGIHFDVANTFNHDDIPIEIAEAP
jgi:hypothetical protein